MSHQALEKLLVNHINFTASQREQGSLSHTHIREILGNKADYDSAFPWLVNGDFLSGSYARGTKIYPLDDIDVMIVLDGEGLSVIEQGVIQDIEIRGSGIKGSPVSTMYIPGTNLISSQKVLQKFAESLKETYPKSEIKKDGQAVNVWLESYGLGIDIVPCFHLKPRDGSTEHYFIPEGGGSHGWVKTNPKLDNDLCDYLHEKHDKKLKHIIRLLKFWNVDQNGTRLKPYHLDVLIWKVFLAHPGKITSYPEGIKYFFDNVVSHLSVECPDLWKLSGNVDSYLTPEIRQQILKKVREMQTILSAPNPSPNRGLLLPPTSLNSVVRWKKVFGDKLEE
jgi:hypothetical protein